MNVFEVFLKVLPLLVSVVLGFLLYKKGFLKDEFIDGFKKIVVNVTLPAGLLIAFASIDFKLKYIFVFLAVFAACLLIFLIGKASAKLLKMESPYLPFLISGFEAGMMGYAVYGSIYGLDRLSEFGIIDVGQVLFVFIVSVPLIASMGKAEKGGFFKQSYETAVNSPVIWSIIVGLALSILGIGKVSDSLVYTTIEEILEFISRPTPVLIGLVVGSGLRFSFSKMKKETLTAVAKVVISVLFGLMINALVLKPLGLDQMLRAALLTMFVLPGPFVIPVFMKSGDRSDVEYVSNTLSIGTMAALIGAVAVSFFV